MPPLPTPRPPGSKPPAQSPRVPKKPVSPPDDEPIALDESDMDNFEGMFNTARGRREAQQVACDSARSSGGLSATEEAQRRMYGAVLSPRVVKPAAKSWTRVAPYDKDLYHYNASDKIAANYSPRAAT